MRTVIRYEDLSVGDVVRFYDSWAGILYDIIIVDEDEEGKLNIWREKARYNIAVHPYKNQLMWPVKIIETIDDIPDYFMREFQDEVVDPASKNGIKYNLKM